MQALFSSAFLALSALVSCFHLHASLLYRLLTYRLNRLSSASSASSTYPSLKRHSWLLYRFGMVLAFGFIGFTSSLGLGFLFTLFRPFNRRRSPTVHHGGILDSKLWQISFVHSFHHSHSHITFGLAGFISSHHACLGLWQASSPHHHGGILGH